ncbi:MAG: phenylalanine--tRNA ligase subunit beta [Minwuiales bacterium]|nr:phenylalanine--tRNA ligase subunit beta [Minwuiales bacterium]
MKLTLSWLKEHLETDADLQTVVDKLTDIGLEVEEVIDRAAELAPFTVAHVVSAEQHPNADKLRVCIVDTGTEQVQVVCGAPNARTGMKGVFAPSGTTIPGTGLHLKPTNIRGVDSNGMLCSEREMGLSDEHDGIIDLPADAKVGEPFAALMGLGDPVIDIAITPNRQDCLGVHGIARDLAAAGLGRLKTLDIKPVPGDFDSPIGVDLDFPADRTGDCPMFAGRLIRGVKNGPSPKWLQDKLLAIGLRPISTLVDITNYVTYDLNRPLHVFDADKLKGNLRVHPGIKGESLLALDGKEYPLDPEICAISDDSGPVSLGGIMGGETTGCTEETVNVFVEAALFDPVRTAASGRRLNILSDARYRFERGVDPSFVVTGMEAATRLIMDLCGGTPSHLVVSGKEPGWKRTVTLRPHRVAQLTGIEVPEPEMVRILGELGFEANANGGDYRVSVPPWRNDVDAEADLIEDISRIYGFDKLPTETLPRLDAVARPTLTPIQKRVRTARRALAGRGMVEAVTWSFLPREQARLFGGGDDQLVLANPISSDLDTMRPSILPNLIAAAGRNMDRGFANVALFEVGPQYADDSPTGQAIVAAGIRRGDTAGRHWAAGGRPVDTFDAKADALATLAACGAPVQSLQVQPGAADWYHPGRSGALQLGPKNVLAWFGDVHPAVLDAMDVKGPLVAFELFLANIPTPKGRATTTRPPLDISDLQAVERDFAFVVDAGTSADQLIRAARGADKALIADVQVFDVYEGERIGAGKKSIAISVRLEPREKTLTDAEIDAIGQKVVAQIAKATGGELRN